MATGKKRGAPAPRPRSGFVTEEQRNTERLTLRLDPDTMDRLRSFAEEHGWTAAKCVAEAFNALERELEAQQAHNDALDEGASEEDAAVTFADVYLTAYRKHESEEEP